jgi:hypothetical protein
MENLALKTKFKSLLQKTGKINFEFNTRNDSLNSPSCEGGRIPPEWAGLVGIGAGGRRDEGVFVSNENEMSKTDDEVLSRYVFLKNKNNSLHFLVFYQLLI